MQGGDDGGERDDSVAEASGAAPNDDGPATPSISVWRRWGPADDVPLHRYCDLFLGRRSGDIDPPREEEYWIYITDGTVRRALRHTPLVILLFMAVLGSAKLVDGWPMVLSLPGGATPTYLVLTVLLVLLWASLLLWLLNRVELLPRADLVQAVVIYGTMLVLLGDVVYWFTRVSVVFFGGSADQIPEASIIPGSGFLLIMFVGGLLVYDGMLRTESMFSCLHRKEPSIVSVSSSSGDDDGSEDTDSPHPYQETFVSSFKSALEDDVELGHWLGSWTDRDVSIPTAYLFSVVFVLPFVVLPPFVFDLSRLDVFTGVALSLLGFVEVVIFFQFLVIIRHFNQLLTEHSPYEDATGDGFTLLYRPDHPDGYAGFQDLGRFAIRVNTLLFFAGLFTVYWLYTGVVPIMAGSADAVPAWVVLVGGGFHYLTPLLVYVLTVVVWLYTSFWQIHKAMRKGRERRISMAIDGSPDGELPRDELSLRDGPVWPLNVRLFASIVVGDAIPLLSIVPLLL